MVQLIQSNFPRRNMATEAVSQDLQDGVSSAVAAFTRAVRNRVFLFSFHLTEKFLPLL